MQSHTKWFGFLFVSSLIGFFGVDCQSGNRICNGDLTKLMPCGDGTSSESVCKTSQFGGVDCCYTTKNTGGPKCLVDVMAVFAKNVSSPQQVVQSRDDFAKKVGVFQKPSNQEISRAANNVPGADSEEVKRQLGNVPAGFNQQAQRRSLTFAFAALGGGSSLLKSAFFPECPVHVKYCYRVPCGGTYNPLKEVDATSCLSDPTCCYDYTLAFMRTILGERFMDNTPNCYYGPTSNQWKFITGFFRPWNSWYTSFIIDALPNIFDTAAYDSAGQFACSITGLRKAYPVGSKSKLECSLVSGCWDDSLPDGSKCTMASSFAQNLFGNIPGIKKEVYPSLYTNDPADTKCSSNWFDFGPKAYRRMPCGIGDAPDDFIGKLSWCPLNDCCLNYASLNPQDLLYLSAFGGGGSKPFGGGISNPFGGGISNPFGGGVPSIGNPFGGGGLNIPGIGGGTTSNTVLAYLIQGSSGSTGSLSDLFCPFRNFFAGSSSSLFPDLSEYTDGCCTIPVCYHKKNLRDTGYIGWSQWSDCSSPCGPGTRTRQCFANNQRVSPFTCGGGSASEQCTGINCVAPPPTAPPSFPEWSSWSACSRTCGNGGTRTRTCIYNGQQVTDSSCGPGSSFGSCYNGDCPTAPPPPPVFAAWSQWTSCSRTCGNGGTRTRSCLYNGQQVADSNCGFASSTEPCFNGECSTPPPPPVFAAWSQWTACSRTCGSGGVRTRTCLYNNQQVASTNCGFSSSQEPCFEGNCAPPPPPVGGTWGGWQPVGTCSKTCGGGTQTWSRPCLVNNVQVSSSSCTGGPATATANCGNEPCPVASGSWSVWRDQTNCGETCGSMRIKEQVRSCTTFGGSALPDSACVGAAMRVVQCPDVACPRQYYWTGYTLNVNCEYSSTTGRCARKSTRYCYERTSSGWKKLEPQLSCPGETQKEENCNFSECT